MKSLKQSVNEFAMHMQGVGFSIHVRPKLMVISCCRVGPPIRGAREVSVNIQKTKNPVSFSKISKKFLKSKLSKFGLEMFGEYFSDSYPQRRCKRKKFYVRRAKV